VLLPQIKSGTRLNYTGTTAWTNMLVEWTDNTVTNK
jgi:hypothetical protein